VFLDVDGTLLEIAPTPQAVEVPADLVGLLARLHDLVGGALALVSGRPVAELDRLFGPERFAAAGVHGAELRMADGSHVRAPAGPDLREARAAFQAFVDRHPGAHCEDKGVAVTLHYRLAPDTEEEARCLAGTVAERLGPDVELLHGKMVVELRPSGANKGRAVEAFLSNAPFVGRIPVYVGDDLTDEDAFAEVNRLGGVSVLVGARSSSVASARLPTPRDVRRWLAEVVSTLRRRTYPR
jgi:trehalose 6-phosphate phosphatase